MRNSLHYLILNINSSPFPSRLWFLRVCSTSLLKTLWEKEKLLLMSNFSFSHSVFCPFDEQSAIFIKFEFVVSTSANSFNLDQSKILLFGKGLVDNKNFICILLCTSMNPLPHMAIMGSSNLVPSTDMMSKIWTNGDTIISLNRKHCGKRINFSLQAISSFPTMFLKAVCC